MHVPKYTTLKSAMALLAIILLVLIAAQTRAHDVERVLPFGFKHAETEQLDEAIVNLTFRPRYYQNIAIKWRDFDYQPVTSNPHADIYEMTDLAKKQLELDAKQLFAKRLEDLIDFDVIEFEDATPQTMLVYFKLEDIVNYVPDVTQLNGQQTEHLRDLRAMTLRMEFIDGGNGNLLFKGHVRETIGASGANLKHATPYSAQQRTKRQLQRWARDFERVLDKLKVK